MPPLRAQPLAGSRAWGYRSLFLDFDPDHGIAAGTDWEAQLYRHLKLSRAIVALVTDSFVASHWCFAEVVQARAMGKPVFPLKIAPCSPPPVLGDVQIVDLTRNEAEGWERLPGPRGRGAQRRFPLRRGAAVSGAHGVRCRRRGRLQRPRGGAGGAHRNAGADEAPWRAAPGAGARRLRLGQVVAGSGRRAAANWQGLPPVARDPSLAPG